MMQTWRDRLKTGPLGGVYSAARRAKRRLRGEPLAGIVPFAYTLADADELRELAALIPGQPRCYFSLALDYLAEPTEINLRRAEACLRTAGALGFESAERITLFRAQILALRGNPKAAGEKAAALRDYELTAAENALRERLVNGGFPSAEALLELSPQWLAAKQELETNHDGAESLLICDDGGAVSFDWLPEARFLFAMPEITGLTPASAASLNLTFAVGIGTAESQAAFTAAGGHCARWIILKADSRE